MTTSDPAALLAGFEPEDGSWFEHAGRRIVTRGAARTIVVPPGPDLVERFAAAASDALREDTPLLIGAVPFSPQTQAILTVPEAVSNDAAPLPLPVPSPAAPSTLRCEPFPEASQYEREVAAALALIASGELRKIVLARMLIAHAERPFDRRRLIATLRASEPTAATFAVQGFFGATPELLIRRTGDQIQTQPLAGTSRHVDDPSGSRLLSSEKERDEHRVVVDAVRAALQPITATLDVPAEPSLVATSSLWHLGTTITGTLAEQSTTALDLVAALHPTPAVCGIPVERARATIHGMERFDRMLYAGAVGWMDAHGDGEWFVALRCAEVRGRLAMLFAGAGIVAGSKPAEERAETDAKFRPMLAALESCQAD